NSQNNDSLPSLGDASSGSISLAGEYDLGRLWLSLFRSSAKEYNDPITKSYVKDFIYRISESSEVRDRRYEFIILDDASINAFAAPGGIIGINTGMFLKTETEGQFASVMCHELAHLSQRHYARSQQNSSPLTNALILLGSVATAVVTANPQAILIAPALIQQLATNYTRDNEREADRIGFRNLVNAGFDPKSQSQMFQILQKTQGGINEEYSYLFTHPIPKERITDARIRETSIDDEKSYRNSLEFYLVKARAEVNNSKNMKSLEDLYISKLKNNLSKKISISNKYGLSLTLKEQKKFDEAKKIARELIKENPTNLIFQTNILEIYLAEENSLEAISLGKDLLKIHTNNYFISYYLSKAYILNGDPDKAEELLINLSKINPEDPFVWYELAEAQGLSGNIIGLHRSRAEYFVLTGRYDSAIYQLREGLKLSKNFFEIRESIINKLEQIYQTKRALKDLT
ncbi:MAG: M48 family metalloprotease, partial [Gammaproteobacteria bacterium]